MAKVVPIFKLGDTCREDVNTYRPIAVLLTIAQDFQRFIFEQFNAYFNENEFLYSHQSTIDTNV